MLLIFVTPIIMMQGGLQGRADAVDRNIVSKKRGRLTSAISLQNTLEAILKKPFDPIPALRARFESPAYLSMPVG